MNRKRIKKFALNSVIAIVLAVLFVALLVQTLLNPR